MDREVFYLAIVCLLLVVPRLLQRVRIPAPLTALVLGIVVANVSPGGGGIVHFAAVLGITSLFLFAGLEVNFSRMRARATALAIFAVLRLGALAAMTLLAQYILNLPWQDACLIALALLTSSTGFILDSFDQFGIEGEDRELVANEAILGEILALGVLFFVLQSADSERLLFSSVVLVVLIAAIPLLYWCMARWILPHAPESEFSLLVMAAIVAGFVTERLGVEYLLGAFIAGMMASQMSGHFPMLESPNAMQPIKLFSSFFMPFYFFRSGELIAHEALTSTAMIIGALFCLLILLRWLVVWLRFRLTDSAPGRESRLSMSLLPTLIFTLVLGQILHRDFNVGEEIIGGLIIYAIAGTLLPSLLFGRARTATQKTSD